MSWFFDLKMVRKIGLLFGALAVMLVVVGVVGIKGIGETNEALALAYGRDMKGVDLANQLDIQRLKIARSYRQGLLSRNQAARDAVLRELDDEERAFTTLFPQLKATLVTDEARARLADAERDLPEYLKLSREAVHASETDMARAEEILSRSSPIGLKVGASFEAIVAAKRHVAEMAEAEAAERGATSRNVVVGITLMALLLAVAASVLSDRAVGAPLRTAVALLDRVAEGDLTQRLEVTTRDEVGELATAVNRSLDSMRTALLGVQDISSEVSSAATQLASSATEISGGAQAQAASLEETAASLEEISSTVKQNADNAQQAAQLASGARDAAEKGGAVVESAVAAMTEITKSSKKIADIITTIDEIAFQTNLLALNAAVEAARAGEQGRGFGVVAAEVRTLAQRTGAAAKEIRGLIADSTAKVEVGTQQVNRSGETLSEIVRSVKRVTDMISEIAAASREQNTGVDQVNTAVTEVDQVTQGNAAQTEELSATATSLSQKAGHLQDLVAGFELGQQKRLAPRDLAPVAAKKRSAPRRAAKSPPPLHRPATEDRDSGVHMTIPPAAKTGTGFEEF